MKESVKYLLSRLGLLSVARRGRRRLRRAGKPIRRAMQARGWTQWKPLVPADSFTTTCEQVIELLKERGHEFGDYLEFGVSRGTSMACMSAALERAQLLSTRLIGFDSFAGMPVEASSQGWRAGDYASTRKATRRYLKKAGADLTRVELVKGWFRDTLKHQTVRRLNLRKASIVMVDCDIYTASKEALWFCEPLIRDVAVVIFDDWGSRADHGEVGQKEAFAEFLDAFPNLSAQPLDLAYIPAARVFLLRREARDGLDLEELAP